MSTQNNNIKSGEFSDRGPGHRLDPRLLQSEIDFWRSLIESQPRAARSRESIERMQQALALAEYRLATISSNRYTVAT
jgi:hypothetical protein